MATAEDENKGQGSKDKVEEGESSEDSSMKSLYIASAKELVSNLMDPTDKELSSLWLDYIVLHINDVPVMFDYLKLFLLSLQQAERVPPFNDIPPPIEDIAGEHIDVISMGRQMIENHRTKLQEKRALSPTKPCADDKEAKETVPLIEFGSSLEHKDYFATQRIPMFGRQCFYTSSPNELPFWWPIEPGAGYPRDYLGRIAWFMYWEENKKMSKLDECNHRRALSTRTWWKDAVEMKRKHDKDSALGFRWYNLSLLPHSRAKLDKKQIQKFFKSVESKGLEVFAIDENAESIKDTTVPDSEKLTIAQTIKDILDKRSHGTVDPNKTFADVLQERLKEKEYNKNWYTSFEEEDEKAESAENFLRKVKENSIKRLLQTSPESINVDDETQIKRLKQLYCADRTGEEPPPPSPDEGSSHDLLRRGLSWNIPAFKRYYSSSDVCAPCKVPEVQVGQASQPPCSPKRASFGGDDFGAGPCDEDEQFGSPSGAFGDFEPCEPAASPTVRVSTPVCDPSGRASFRRESQGRQPSPCKERFSAGAGSLGSFGAGSRVSSPAKAGERFSMGGASLGSFGAGSRVCSPAKPGERFSMGGASLGSFGAGSRVCSPAKPGERFSMGGASLGSFGAGSRTGSPCRPGQRFSMADGSFGSFGAGSKRGSRQFSMGHGGSMGSFGAGSRPGSPGGAEALPPGTKRESLCFENAEELDFMDQFLLPTTDVDFDEDDQEAAAGWMGGYDDADDDWVAPPEIEPEEPFEIGLPPVGLGEGGEQAEGGEEEEDRREGRMFMPTERKVYTDEELGTIDWPEKEHLYDININFPEDDPPFDYLELGTPCEDFPEPQNEDEFANVRWRNLGLVADQLGFQNFPTK